MKKIIILLVAVFILCSYSGSASAMLLDIVPNGNPYTGTLPLGDAHDVAVTSGATGWYDANLYATTNVLLTYEFLGYEAGWTNTLVVDGSEVFWNKDIAGNLASIVGDTAASFAAAGSLLDFSINILAGGNAGYGVDNGSNVAPTGIPNVIDNGHGRPNFFLGYVDSSMNSVYITFDDGGGPYWNKELEDDNHDDLVMKVTATAVPEPATMLMLGSGLAGFFVFRKKFQI